MLYAKISNGEAIAFPYSDYALMQDNKNVSFPADLDDETRAEYGMVPVVAVDVPHGKISTGSTAELIEASGRRSIRWKMRRLRITKAAKKAAINAKLETVPPADLPSPPARWPAKVLQTRNLEDRTNWLISQTSYSAAVAGGMGAVEGRSSAPPTQNTFTR